MGSGSKLLKEAEDLISRSRVALTNAVEALTTSKTQTQTQRRSKTMSVDANATRAGELYAGGKSVAEVAAEMSITYSQARRLIKDSGTPVRDASARLKGRTRKINS
jgi:hypothetical protein